MASSALSRRRAISTLVRRIGPILGLLLTPLPLSVPALAQNPPAPDQPAPSVSLDLDVIAQQLDIARNQIQPSLGASVYQFTRPAIENQPQGDNAPMNQVLLQAPGVAQDSFGQLHVRGDHANLQFRLNGVQLPEGINVFGQALETRLAHSIALITGALPASAPPASSTSRRRRGRSIQAVPFPCMAARTGGRSRASNGAGASASSTIS